MAEIRRVGVLGCGLMGSGIAQLCAQAGYDTLVRELSEDALQRGLMSAPGLQKVKESLPPRGTPGEYVSLVGIRSPNRCAEP